MSEQTNNEQGGGGRDLSGLMDQINAFQTLAQRNDEIDIERIKFILKHRPTPPISDYQFQELTEEVEITKRNKERIGDCSVCCCEFDLEDFAIKLPCKHYYHYDCITQWLKLHSSCPNCREIFGTDDYEYDDMRRHLDNHEKKQKNGGDPEEQDEDRSIQKQRSTNHYV
ncbi:hypothetical protein DFA_01724 [Cavenderia fasciculata]|uniref:RING-type domain-containing protein n=1 Tax=Cavenderia fasciculata TaxID=261658 RepID=F4PUC3_CACFS|nr:uncharacterized protein DFA_01724 [Cavenderia fasciculata]EGG21838.1 hypothetical protein DFA_01724 [Cavenderia fasciculata]|eukprot:XP_004359688.1 hypothetical protein DFA_01724 [Cavenderia fasciculata]